MGKGKIWKAEENQHLAEAWISTSEEVGETKLKGTDQTESEFWSKVMVKFKSKCPVDKPDGIYHERGPPRTLQNHWRDHISRDVKKFNKSLSKVFRSNPTGCSEQNKINMAVAIHLGKIDAMSYRYKDFEAMDWKYYRCWLVLKDHRLFLPPSVEAETVELEDDTVADEEEAPLVTNGSEDTTEAESVQQVKPPIAILKMSKKKSRGPGYGDRKTKALAALEDYKKKKAKCQEGMLAETQKKNQYLKAFVKNQARQQSFNMAIAAYKTFQDADPMLANQYKQHIKQMVAHETEADETDDEEMPALTGSEKEGNNVSV